jgi:hypothetical protein
MTVTCGELFLTSNRWKLIFSGTKIQYKVDKQIGVVQSIEIQFLKKTRIAFQFL